MICIIKRKNIFLLSIVIFFGIMPSNAKVRIGGKVGLNFARGSLSVTENADCDISTQYGTLAQFLVEGTLPWKNLFYETGLGYFQKGVKNGIHYSLNDAQQPSLLYIDEKEQLGYITIPLNLKYKMTLTEKHPLKGYVAFGMFLDFGVEGNNTSEYTYNHGIGTMNNLAIINRDITREYNINFGSGQNDKYKAVDCGLNFGAGIEAINHIILGFNYSLGLKNIYNSNYSSEAIYPSYTNSVKNRIWTLYLGYLF